MKKNIIILIAFLLSSFAFSQSADDFLNELFLNSKYEKIYYDTNHIIIAVNYIDSDKQFFDKLLMIYSDEERSKVLFKIDGDQIYDFWSNKAETAPIPKDFVFYGYKINIKDNMNFSLDVYSNGGKNYIKSARVYFWNSVKKIYEPYY